MENFSSYIRNEIKKKKSQLPLLFNIVLAECLSHCTKAHRSKQMNGIQDVCLQPNRNNSNCFHSPPETTKKLTKYVKHQFARHWTLDNKQEWCSWAKQAAWALQLHSLTAWEFPRKNRKSRERPEVRDGADNLNRPE